MRLVSEITASRESVENVGKHRKERCPDTLLRQVGSLTGNWHFHISFEYRNKNDGYENEDIKQKHSI